MHQHIWGNKFLSLRYSNAVAIRAQQLKVLRNVYVCVCVATQYVHAFKYVCVCENVQSVHVPSV